MGDQAPVAQAPENVAQVLDLSAPVQTAVQNAAQQNDAPNAVLNTAPKATLNAAQNMNPQIKFMAFFSTF